MTGPDEKLIDGIVLVVLDGSSSPTIYFATITQQPAHLFLLQAKKKSRNSQFSIFLSFAKCFFGCFVLASSKKRKETEG